jgi:protein-L-isoaspartate(D-aspartate) O-methyltransferase
MISELGRTSLARRLARATQRLGCPMTGQRRQDDLHGRLGVGPPGGVDHQRTSPRSRADPVAGELTTDRERGSRARLVRRPRSLAEQRTVGDADGRHAKDGAEVECKAGAPGMVAPRGVDEQHVGRVAEFAYGGLERRTLAEGEHARRVRRARRTANDGGLGRRPRGGTQRVTGGADSVLSAHRADEAAADHVRSTVLPRRRLQVAERVLDVDQVVGRGRPDRHGRQDSPVAMFPSEGDLLAVLRSEGIEDTRLLDAVRAVPRGEFVPPGLAERAYFDSPLPIPHGQVTTQPSLVARVVEALALTGDERVLEVGTGYGWQTALLARLAGEVWSVERWEDLAVAARDNLTRHGVTNATVVVGDGSEGLPSAAPFGAILVSAAFLEVPGPLREQLAPGGRLVQPVGPGGLEDVVLFERRSEGLVRRRTITGAHFVRLVGRHGFPA